MRRPRTKNTLSLIIWLFFTTLYFALAELNYKCHDYCKNGGTCLQVSQFLFTRSSFRCEPPWAEFQSMCFRIFWKTTSWEEANSICTLNKASLIPNKFELSFNSLFPDIMKITYADSVREKLNFWTNICVNGSCSAYTQQSDFASSEPFDMMENDKIVPVCFYNITNEREISMKQCRCCNNVGTQCEDEEDGFNLADSLLNKTVSCPQGNWIRIDYASFSDSDCQNEQESTTYSPNALFLMKYWCQGKRYCPVHNVKFDEELYLKTKENADLSTSRMSYRNYCDREDNLKCVHGDYLEKKMGNDLTCLKPICGDFNWWSALEKCRSMGGNLAFFPNDTDAVQALLGKIDPVEFLHASQVWIWIKAAAEIYQEPEDEKYHPCTYIIVDMENKTLTAVEGKQDLPCYINTQHYWLCRFLPDKGRGDCPHNATAIEIASNTHTCYLLGQEKLIYGEARAKCENMNGTLASFFKDKHSNNDKFFGFLKTSLISASQDYWIGGVDNEYRPINGTFQPCSRIKKDVSAINPQSGPTIEKCTLNEVRNAICAYPPSDYPTESNETKSIATLPNNKRKNYPTTTLTLTNARYVHNNVSISKESTLTQAITDLPRQSSTTPVIRLIPNGGKKQSISQQMPQFRGGFSRISNLSSAFPNLTENIYDPVTTTSLPVTETSTNIPISSVTQTDTTLMPTSNQRQSSTVSTKTSAHMASKTTDLVSSPSTRHVENANCSEKIFDDERGSKMVWPSTEGGILQEISCPGKSKGTARWFCDGTTGIFTPSNRPDLSDCRIIHEALNELLEQKKPPRTIANKLLVMLQDTIFGGDLMTIITLIPQLNEKQDQEYEKLEEKDRLDSAKNYTNTLMDIFDKLLSENHSSAWLDYPQESRVNISSQLLKLVDSVGFALAAILKNNYTSIKRKHLEFFVSSYPKEKYKDEEIIYPLQPVGDSTFIVLPKSTAIKGANENGTVHSVFVKYFNLSLVLPSASFEGATPINITLKHNSEVLGASVGKDLHFDKDENVKIIFKYRISRINNSETVCVFWNMKRSGFWDDNGCIVDSTNATHTVCLCDHMTNFAVLMDIQGVLEEGNDEDVRALTWITVIGCTISIICLVLSCLIFISFRSLWNLRNAIHCNLCLSLLVSQVVLLVGLDRTESKVGCGFVAGLLHFSWLAAFVWMAAEGVMIYILLIKVFETGEQKAWHYYIASYGIPALIVIVSASCRWEGYGTPQFCWLSKEDGLIFAFAGPLAVIIIFNLIILALALKAAASVKLQRHQSKVEVARLWIKRAVSLVPLLGLSWIFGFLYIDNSSVIFAYLFSIFNSIQGIFIFIFHCLRNEKVQQVVSRYIAKKRERLDSLTFSGKSSRSNSCTVTTSVRTGSGSTSTETPPSSGKKQPGYRGIFPKTRVAPARWRYRLDITNNSICIEPNGDYDVMEPNANFKKDPCAINEPEDNKSPNGVFFRVRSSSDVSV